MRGEGTGVEDLGTVIGTLNWVRGRKEMGGEGTVV